MNKYFAVILALIFCIGGYIAVSYLPGGRQIKSDELTESPDDPEGYFERVVCINPAATEIIYAVGGQGRLVGVSDFCDYPAKAREMTKVGGAINPNFEKISVLNPDLIIIQGQIEEVASYCQRNGVECLSVNLRRLDEIYNEIINLGGRLGRRAQAQELCEKIRVDLSDVQEKVDGLERRKVFLSLYRVPGSLASVTTAGPDTHLSELISIAGGVNIFSDVERDYPTVSKESLVKRGPEVIIETWSAGTSEGESKADLLDDWQKLDAVEAVENGRVYAVEADVVLKPGPRVGKAAEMLARCIHPEAFDE